MELTRKVGAIQFLIRTISFQIRILKANNTSKSPVMMPKIKISQRLNNIEIHSFFKRKDKRLKKAASFHSNWP